MLNIIKAVCVIIGTIIGAGFASGREIYIFFYRFGSIGIIGILISSLLTGIVIYKVLTHIKSKKIKNYNEYIESLGVNKKIRDVLGIIINIFLVICFFIMTAGFSAYFRQEFGISQMATGIVMAILCYFTFLNNIEGVSKINTILIPALMIMVVILGVKNGFGNLSELSTVGQLENTKGWFLASIEYASYNTILLIPILIGLKKYSFGKEKEISIASSSILFILSIILYVILLSGGNSIQNAELPLIHIVNKFGSIYKYICGIIVVAAIFTSAIAAGYGFLENSTKTKKRYKLLAIVICISSIFVSQLRFFIPSRFVISRFWINKFCSNFMDYKVKYITIMLHQYYENINF